MSLLWTFRLLFVLFYELLGLSIFVHYRITMQDRMKMRSVSFSDEAPPAIPPRNPRNPVPNHHRRQTSAESLPLYENHSELNGSYNNQDKHLRLNSLPRMIPHHRRKILDFNRPSSSLAGHYQYLGDPLPDYANLTNISRRGTFYNQRQNGLKQGNFHSTFRYPNYFDFCLNFRVWRHGL